MKLQRLHWRIGLPFALFVLAGSVALVTVTGWRMAAEERERFEMLARTNADFLDKMNLPPSARMADELEQVLGVNVLFRREGVLTPGVLPLVGLRHLHTLPADRRCHVFGGTWEGVAVPLDSGHDLVLFRHGFAFRSIGWLRGVLPVLVAFWLLALAFGWLVSRGLVRPLQHLAAKMPDIEKPGAPGLPEAARRDEIGDVARAFVRTREALQTERAERERAEKLAVLGRMTAALAHEIQNPVSAIKMHAQLWQGRGGDDTAHIIEREAARIESLVNQWMFLSKPEPPTLGVVDLPALLAQTVKLHQAQCDHAQVQVTLDTAPDITVQGDAKRLTQAFSNLLINAIQAMPRGGQLTVSCAPASPGLEVRFADTGKGFSAEALTRFSEFFFSEKEGGMGIGLSVASEIVKAHGGELRAANRAEGGACVTVSLPVRPASPL